MAPSRPRPALGRAAELLIETRDPAERARILLAAVHAAFGAHASALCRPRADGSWARVAVAGEPEALPSLEQVAAVAAGELPRHLPPQRAVFVAAEGLALALAGVEEDARHQDDLDALLLVYAAAAACDAGPAGLEEVPSALPPPRPDEDPDDDLGSEPDGAP